MTLTATAIRQDLVARLVAANVAGGAGHIWDSRLIDLKIPELPAVFVLSDDPVIEKLATDAMFYGRTEKVGAYAICTATTDALLAQAVDDLEDAILTATIGDPVWAGSFGDFKITVQKMLNLSSERAVAGVAVIFTTEYTLDYPYPAGSLDGLERIAVTTEPIQPAGANVSTRLIEVTPP